MIRLAVGLLAAVALTSCASRRVEVQPALRADLIVIGKVHSVEEQTVMVGDVAEIWPWVELALPTNPASRVGFFQGMNCTIREPTQQRFLVFLNWQPYGHGQRNAGYYQASVCLPVDDATSDGILKEAWRYAAPETRKP